MPILVIQSTLSHPLEHRTDPMLLFSKSASFPSSRRFASTKTGSSFAGRCAGGPVLCESLRRKVAARQTKRNKKAGRGDRLSRLPYRKPVIVSAVRWPKAERQAQDRPDWQE